MTRSSRPSGWTDEIAISSKSLSRSLAQVQGASGVVVLLLSTDGNHKTSS